MVGSRPSLASWVTAATTSTRVDFEGNVSSMSKSVSDMNLGFGERAFSAAGAAAISAILVNPLDIAKVKTRLQAQAAGVPYHYQGPCPMACFDTNTMLPDLKSTTSSARALLGSGSGSEPVCPSDCNRYTGTLDVLYKVIRQEGFTRLWRGTNASLALAVPTAFKETQIGVKPPGVWKTLLEVINPVKSTNLLQNLQNYRVLWTGLGAQLARDVPFSAICWSTLEPIRRRILGLVGDEASAPCILGANFSAGFVAGILAAAATCPLDVAKTRRQIEVYSPPPS
ncbi:hypothetical protein ACJW31_11G065700 [Castanea mollissima]